MQKFKPCLFALLLLLSLPGCNDTKSPAGPAYSYSIGYSKDNGVFQFEVSCSTPVFLLDKIYKCNIESAWVENAWNKQAMVFGKPKVERFDSLFQLIIQLNISRLPYKQKDSCFYFIGREPLDSFIHYRCRLNNTSTIKVPLYKQINDEPLSKKQKAFDTLVFFKKLGNG